MGVPVFNTVADAIKETGANTSIIFVPAAYAADAILEASEAGIELVIAISEGVPTLDMVRVTPYLQKKGTMLIGANCPGLISPDEAMVGILPGGIFKKGNIGLMSRSGTLTYEMVFQLTSAGLGQSTCVGIGGDPVAGLYYQELLQMFEDDPETDAIVLIGEIGGDCRRKGSQIYSGTHYQTGRKFYRRTDRPSGETDGTCRCNYLQRNRHCCRENSCFRKCRRSGGPSAFGYPRIIKKITENISLKKTN